jgi:hypothetical protein
MNLIRTILDRLSDSFFISVPDRLTADPLAGPSLRLVSDKSAVVADAPSRRLSSQAGSQLDAIDDAILKAIGSPNWKPIPRSRLST